MNIYTVFNTIVLTASNPKFSGFGTGFSWDRLYTQVQSFTQQYIFAGFGLLGFLVFVAAGLLIATSGFAQREDDQYHKAKKMGLSFIIGVTISLAAASIVLMISTLF